MKAVAYAAEVAGIALFSFGVWRIYHPAAYIVLGLLLLLMAVSLQKRGIE